MSRTITLNNHIYVLNEDPYIVFDSMPDMTGTVAIYLDRQYYDADDFQIRTDFQGNEKIEIMDGLSEDKVITGYKTLMTIQRHPEERTKMVLLREDSPLERTVALEKKVEELQAIVDELTK